MAVGFPSSTSVASHGRFMGERRESMLGPFKEATVNEKLGPPATATDKKKRKKNRVREEKPNRLYKNRQVANRKPKVSSQRRQCKKCKAAWA